MIAGLPPVMGLYAAAIPAIVGALFRSSRHVVTGPTNALSLLVGSAVAAQAATGGATPMEVGVTLAFMVGVFQFLAGVLRLDAVADYISQPVVRGYITGAAVLIAIGQLPNVTGTKGGDGHLGACYCTGYRPFSYASAHLSVCSWHASHDHRTATDQSSLTRLCHRYGGQYRHQQHVSLPRSRAEACQRLSAHSLRASPFHYPHLTLLTDLAPQPSPAQCCRSWNQVQWRARSRQAADNDSISQWSLQGKDWQTSRRLSRAGTRSAAVLPAQP